jgi:hypothetical protein
VTRTSPVTKYGLLSRAAILTREAMFILIIYQH